MAIHIEVLRIWRNFERYRHYVAFSIKGIVPLQRFRRYAAVLDPKAIVSPGEQREAIRTYQIATSVLIYLRPNRRKQRSNQNHYEHRKTIKQ